MPMRIPEADNPYRVDIERTNTSVDSVGLVAAPEAKNATVNAVQGLTKSSFDVLEKAQKFKKLQDETQSLDLINQLKTEGEKLKNDSETGFKRLKGKDALSMPDGSSIHDTYNGRLQTIVRTLADKAGNPEVRAKFNKFAQDYGYNFQNELNTHTIKQAQEYATSVQNNAIQLAYTDAVNGSTDDFINNLSVIKGIVDQNAKIKGEEPNYGTVLTKVYGSRVERLLDDGNLKEASALIKSGSDLGYIDAAHARRYNKYIKAERDRLAKVAQVKNLTKVYASKFTPEVLWGSAYKEATGQEVKKEDYEKAMELSGGDQLEALRIAIIGVQKFKDGVAEYERTGKNPDFGDALPKALKAQKVFASGLGAVSGDINQIANQVLQENPNLDLDTVRKVSLEVARNQKQINGMVQAERNNQFNLMLDALQNGVDYDDLPTSSMNKLPESAKATYRRVKALETRESRVTDPAVYQEYIDPNNLKKLTPESLIRLAPFYSKEDFEALVRNAKAVQSGQYTGGENYSNNILHALNLNGLDGDDQKSRVTRGIFLKNLESKVKEQEFSLGRKLSQEEVDKLVNNTIKVKRNVINQGFFKNSNKEISIQDFFNGEADFRPTPMMQQVLDAGLDERGVGEKNSKQRAYIFTEVMAFPEQNTRTLRAMDASFRRNFPDEYGQAYKAAKATFKREPSPAQIISILFKAKESDSDIDSNSASLPADDSLSNSIYSQD